MNWKKKRAWKGQMSEAFVTAIFLSLSGGLQDVYTYLARNHVFANAQTGNIVLLSVKLMEKNWSVVLNYLVPLSFFALGVAVSELVQTRHKRDKNFHWRQRVLAMEMILLFIVGFLPASLNLLANALVSFSCAMQVQAFRKIKGANYASTMCIGNLRSGMEALCHFILKGKKKKRVLAGQYFAVIFCFALGAALGSSLIPYLGMKTIWISCGLLFFSFCLMFVQDQEEEMGS
ncbi:YoaK family protein [Urinicoccus massiliensis]|nr:YoaK family protein [Urinicoccus massiliensis]